LGLPRIDPDSFLAYLGFNVAFSLANSKSFCARNDRIYDLLKRPTKWIAPFTNKKHLAKIKENMNNLITNSKETIDLT
jgi:hypothetical protein